MASARIFSATAPTVSSGGAPVYEAPDWTQVTVLKETSGIVLLGTDSGLLPASSGKGMPLPVDVAITFVIAKGTKLYIVSTTEGERVSFICQPIPGLYAPSGSPIALPGRGF